MLRQSRLVKLGLIIAIGLGLTIEVLKSTRSSQDGSSWRSRIFGLQTSADDSDGLEHRNVQANRARSRLLRDRVAGLSETTASLKPAAATVVAAVPGPPIPNLTPLKTSDASGAKKKAADDAKKKKKKKKKTEEIAAQTNSPTTTDDDRSKSNGGGDTTGGAATTNPQGPSSLVIAGADNIENPETLEQWLTYILREPSYDRTLKLIKGHELHTVDSEIFHEVTTQMLADARAKMHEYAIYALGTAPSLKSFILLETANANEPAGSQLKVMSRANLLAYAKIENLRYLANAISSDVESSSSFEALRLIQIAVADYKPKVAPSTSGPSTLAVAVSRQFSSLVPVLTRVSQISTDASLRQEASTTLRLVQTIVGTPTPVAAAN